MRQGLPHLKDLKFQEIQALLSPGVLSGEAAEKTDGFPIGIGWDQQGFYTRSSRSDKIRNAGEYSSYSTQKYGGNFISPYAHHYDNLHRTLQQNQNLINYLCRAATDDVFIQGEVFWKPLGSYSEGGIRFVGTIYDPTLMGTMGSFILHTRLPVNEQHKHTNITDLSDENLMFYDDKIPNGVFVIDVSDEKVLCDSINYDKMISRKKQHVSEKIMEKEKFSSLKLMLEEKLRTHFLNTLPKFGPESEGIVLHFNDPKIRPAKLTSDSFMKFKQTGK